MRCIRYQFIDNDLNLKYPISPKLLGSPSSNSVCEDGWRYSWHNAIDCSDGKATYTAPQLALPNTWIGVWWLERGLSTWRALSDRLTPPRRKRIFRELLNPSIWRQFNRHQLGASKYLVFFPPQADASCLIAGCAELSIRLSRSEPSSSYRFGKAAAWLQVARGVTVMGS